MSLVFLVHIHLQCMGCSRRSETKPVALQWLFVFVLID